MASATAKPDLASLFDLSPLGDQGLQGYLDTVLERCAVYFEASGASLFLNGGDDVYRLRAKTGSLARIPLTALIEPGEGIAGRILVDGNAKVVNDAGDGTVRSALVVPLIGSDGETVGVLNVSREKDEDEFGRRELQWAKAVAGHIALAIANARLMVEAQHALQASEERHETLRGVLDSVGSAVMVLSPEGDILDRNRQTDALLRSVARAQDFNAVVDRIALSCRNGEENRTARIYDGHGDRTWTLHAVALNDGRVVLTIEEITEHVRTQQEVARVRRLAEIGQMTAAIAHEIRNPLTGIRGAAQMIQQDADTGAEMAKMIEEEVDRLNGLCNDFLDLSRPITLNVRPSFLKSIAQRVHQIEGESFRLENKHLVVEDNTDDQPASVDEGRIEQVMLNLVRNAREASAPGQTVTLTIHNHGFSVMDEGVGLTIDQQGMLFSPFFTTKANGTGLGLTNVRKIIDAHGADISVHSKPGQGTRFEINFPRLSA